MSDLAALARARLAAHRPTGEVLRRMERLASISVILRSGLFDPEWYAAQTGRTFPHRAAAVAHYVGQGRVEGHSPHPLFEPEFLLPEAWHAPGADPFARFVGGSRSLRGVPHPLFDPAVWRDRHPAAGAHPYGPLGHFAATATDDTPMPVVPAVTALADATDVPTWGQARARLWERVAQEDPRRPAPAAGPDWAGLRAGLAARAAGRTSVVVPTEGDWAAAWRTALDVLTVAAEAGPPGADVEVVLADNASRAAVGRVLAGLAAAHPRVRLVRGPVAVPPGELRNRGFAASTGAAVVFLHDRATVWPGWLEPLLAELDGERVLGAQPLLCHPDGTVRSAGRVFPPRGVLPVDLLAGHPVEDAQRIGERVEVGAAAGGALALRAADVVLVRGFDPAFAADGADDVDLCLRLATARPGAFVVRTDSRVTSAAVPATEGAAALADRRLLRDRWGARRPGAEHLWLRAGFDVAHYRVVDPAAPAGLQRLEPVLVRDRTPAAGGPPTLRWAVKISTPAGPRSRRWGDLHFAGSLRAALERLGQQVVVDLREAAVERPSAALDDVVVVLRGLHPVPPQAGRVNLLWVISHPERVTPAELEGFDGVFAASLPWSASMAEASGRDVRPLLQATEAARFTPDAAPPDSGHEVLFVGNSRGVYRPVVRHLVEAGVPVAVFGDRWERFIDPALVQARHVDNVALPAYYAAAGVVLNDHWDDMRREGFLSNRLFDAAACGARVVSDEVAGVDLFGGLVCTFTGAEDLLALVRDHRAAFPDLATRRSIAEGVRREHSFDARARTLLDAALEHWGR